MFFDPKSSLALGYLALACSSQNSMVHLYPVLEPPKGPLLPWLRACQVRKFSQRGTLSTLPNPQDVRSQQWLKDGASSTRRRANSPSETPGPMLPLPLCEYRPRAEAGREEALAGSPVTHAMTRVDPFIMSPLSSHSNMPQSGSN